MAKQHQTIPKHLCALYNRVAYFKDVGKEWTINLVLQDWHYRSKYTISSTMYTKL